MMPVSNRTNNNNKNENMTLLNSTKFDDHTKNHSLLAVAFKCNFGPERGRNLSEPIFKS